MRSGVEIFVTKIKTNKFDYSIVQFHKILKHFEPKEFQIMKEADSQHNHLRFT